jgi:glutamate-1-semialdehyde 2,1-aminomutase
MIDNFQNSKNFSKKIHELIPGGAHTYSKGDDQFPLISPGAIVRGKGAHVWDLDGNEYIDCSMGLTSVSIGHGYEPVAKAVADTAYLGTNFQRPASIELEAAEVFLETVRSGDMVKFAKNGSTVTTAAVKLARAYTGRNKIAIAKEHNFFSYDDWFIVTTPTNKGIPEKVSEMTVSFSYNNFESVEKLFENENHDIACLIMEPMKFDPPLDNFLDKVQKLCNKKNIVFVMDEMVSGFKWSLQGAHNHFGVTADLSTWGKGIANGFSACALTGKKEIMELGGIRREGADKLFLISTTHGAETIGLAAMIATIDSFKEHDMIQSNWERGRLLKVELQKIIRSNGLLKHLDISGCPCLFLVNCRNSLGEIDTYYRTLLLQEMIRRGVLFQGMFYTTWSHQELEIEKVLNSFHDSLVVYKKAIDQSTTDGLLIGPPTKPVFRKKI